MVTCSRLVTVRWYCTLVICLTGSVPCLLTSVAVRASSFAARLAAAALLPPMSAWLSCRSWRPNFRHDDRVEEFSSTVLASPGSDTAAFQALRSRWNCRQTGFRYRVAAVPVPPLPEDDVPECPEPAGGELQAVTAAARAAVIRTAGTADLHWGLPLRSAGLLKDDA